MRVNAIAWNIVIGALVLADASTADACLPPPLFAHETVATGDDTVAPSEPTVEVSTYRLEEGGTCERTGALLLHVAATDNVSSGEHLGFTYWVIDGQPPRRISPQFLDGTTYRGGQHEFWFDYDAPAFAFTLEVRAVDKRGNIGQPTLVEVVGDGPPGEGCSTSGHGAGVGLAALALLLLRRRRRRAPDLTAASDAG